MVTRDVVAGQVEGICPWNFSMSKKFGTGKLFFSRLIQNLRLKTLL